jgi:hypothetical protein
LTLVRCPRCGRDDAVVRRSRRGVGDLLAGVFFWRTFACAFCGRSFRLFVAPFGLSQVTDLDGGRRRSG